MTSSGEIPSSKNPSSEPGSDDEISVIAVIKKGTSGIPKRARYHYIRELPLASVKSFKKSLQKGKDVRRSQGRVAGSVEAVESRSKASSSAEETLRALSHSGKKKPRVIELGDEISKIELRRQFKMAEENFGEKEPISDSGSSAIPLPGEASILHKLPPGTVLIKQEPRTPNLGPQRDNPPEGNEVGSNTNGSSAGTATNTTSTSSSSPGTSSASSVSSCGSGSSSAGFGGSGSASPLAKVKRIHRATKGGGRKKTVEVVPRRNPKRCGSKKETTMAEVAIPTGTTTRPRPRRLLAIGRQERNEETSTTNTTRTNRRTKPPTMPYMNTRSVTRKLYTVGATYQPPTRRDETEWRDWPVHGMHERPVFHPQVGLAAGYGGRVFWSTPDAEGSNWTYREVLEGPEEVEIVPVDPEQNRTQSTPPRTKRGAESTAESFEVCMHESLHSVLAYCAQIMAPGYRRMIENKKRRRDTDGDYSPDKYPRRKVTVEEKLYPEVQFLGKDSSRIDLSELEDSSISDETLMEISSIYKKLLPIEDQPPSREGSPDNYNRTKEVEGCSSASKNSNDASAIARILAEYNEGLKEPNANRADPSTSSLTATTPCTSSVKEFPERSKDSEEAEAVPNQRTFPGGRTTAVEETAKDVVAAHQEEINGDRWMEELLMDTSLLYCIATGVRQRDLTKYVDSLDAKQSIKWLRRRDG